MGAILDVLPRIAAYAGPAEYTAIVRTCRASHWIPLDTSTVENILRTCGRWRLPGRDFGGVNPMSTFCGKAMWERPPFNLPYCISCKSKGLSYDLDCCRGKDIAPKFFYNLTIAIWGARTCCGGNVFKCPHSKELAEWLTAQGIGTI
jgi:hypothetical protein